MKTKISFFLNNSPRFNSETTKVQVINKYGETTWLFLEDAKNGIVPDSLSWFEPADFRPAFIGEEELTSFIKAYLGIPQKSYRKSDGTIVELPNKAEAEARLDSIKDYFNGNITELKNVVALQPNNKVKCLFGVKASDSGKEYQTVYTQKFLKNNMTNYDKLEKEVIDRKNNGAFPTSTFEVCELKEFVVENNIPNDLPEDDKTDSVW